jgi:hypothetical protein
VHIFLKTYNYLYLAIFGFTAAKGSRLPLSGSFLSSNSFWTELQVAGKNFSYRK